MPHAKAKIVLDGVHKIFGDRKADAMRMLRDGVSKEAILEETGCTVAVNDVSLSIEAGEIFVVMGLSGSGKSTLVRLVNGLIRPSSGKVLIDGLDVASAGKSDLRQFRRKQVAMVFQHFALFPHKTVAENTAFGLKVRGSSKTDRRNAAIEALKQVGLDAWADAYPGELSGGMQQRVGLARCLASDPDILLMDEPFSALDPLIRGDMQDDLLDLQRRLKKTIVFITHDLNEALTLGDRIAIMRDGRVVQVGTGEEIVDRPEDDYVAAFTQDVDRSRVFMAASVRSDPDPVELQKDSVDDALAKMEELNRDALYVMDGPKIAGVVTYRDLSCQDRKQDGLEGSLIRDYPSTNPHTLLNELYPLASAGLPIALVDRRDHLIGVVEPEAVFSRLSATGADGAMEDARPASDVAGAEAAE